MFAVQAISYLPAVIYKACGLAGDICIQCIKPSPEELESGLTPYIHPSCPTDESAAINRVYPGVCDDNSNLFIPVVLIVGAGLLLTGAVVSLVKGYISPRRENQNRYDPIREYRIRDD